MCVGVVVTLSSGGNLSLVNKFSFGEGGSSQPGWGLYIYYFYHAMWEGFCILLWGSMACLSRALLFPHPFLSFPCSFLFSHHLPYLSKWALLSYVGTWWGFSKGFPSCKAKAILVCNNGNMMMVKKVIGILLVKQVGNLMTN